MIRFYSNRELSERLAIRLSKWKRWSREFLPPDPLGGLQSGYARQYTMDQALTVFLGGHLVADLHFSMPESKQIIEELGPWITTYKTARSAKSNQRASHNDVQLYIFRQLGPVSNGVAFGYLERKRILDEPYVHGGTEARHEVYVERPIPVEALTNGLELSEPFDKLDSRILYISRLYGRFMRKMAGKHYRQQDEGAGKKKAYRYQ